MRYCVHLYLLLFSIVISPFCLCSSTATTSSSSPSSENADYIEVVDDAFNLDGSGEFDQDADLDIDGNAVAVADTEIDGTDTPMMMMMIDNDTLTTEMLNITENTTKKINKIDEEAVAAAAALAAEMKVRELSAVLKMTIHRIRQQYKKLDIVFLIDSSSSVGKSNFRSELRFVIKFLSDFNVSFNYTRVSIVTFSSQDKIMRHVDHISEADSDNDKCKLLNFQVPAIDFAGGGTHTANALKQAQDILSKARRHSKKIICLITDGFSNGEDPLPIAQKLKAENVTIITFGIKSGNFAELNKLSSEPDNEYSFLLDSFSQFESLARKALHTDYKIGNAVRIKNSSLCDTLCDKNPLNATSSCCDANAECTCSTISGHYSCLCAPGYYGSGLKGNCQLCPNGTYWHSRNLCKPCPDLNHITREYPSTNASFCACKSGFKADANNRCEVLRCPMLKPPENGYFVKHPLGCDRVLNTACGARCKSGYQLIGSSIRLCRDNGTWSGVEAKCVLKTCPKLPVPYYGMATCKNLDLNLFFDYTTRNLTFMKLYDTEEYRVTELMPIDTDCKFKCGIGYYMIGSQTRNCLPLSKWDGLQTACKQIMCTGLPNVKFGKYDPIDCTDQKVAHGTNCTLTCDPGYDVKGPSFKTCSGKKSGIWSNRGKLPKCVDVTPPTLICPQPFTVPMIEDDDYAIVKVFPPPVNVSDNSEETSTFWLKPSVKEDGVKLTLGTHTFSYIAVDAFRNKAKCTFDITVLDITPPSIDNCISPPEIFIPSSSSLYSNLINNNRTFVDWDAPIIYDNSNTDVNVTQSIHPGHIGIGMHTVTYTATDLSGNQNTCTLNVTVKPLQCNTLLSPGNGQSLCARNETHTWCDLICDLGFTLYERRTSADDDDVNDNDDEEEQSDHVRYMCENDNPQWAFDPLPDCTKTELPDSIEQVFSITLDDDDNGSAICKNNSELSATMMQNLLTTQIRQQLCEEQEQCEIVSEIPDCDEIARNNMERLDEIDETTNRNYYSVVQRRRRRRNTTTNNRKIIRTSKNTNGPTMKIKIYTKISKGLGLWNQSLSRAENIDVVKSELKTYHTNEQLRNKLQSLRINVKHLNLEENLLCRSGSVLKRNICVQCPRGTFHNRTLNSCQLCKLGHFNDKEGQIDCQRCPSYHSTRKLGAKMMEECIEQCPPGTMARVRLRASQKFQNSLMPFCRKCPPAEYQSDFNQIECKHCPLGTTSPRGAISIENCYEEKRQICQINAAICGPHGVCVQENGNIHLYSCVCEDGFTGSHCEHELNFCGSSPCQNNGQCIQTNSTSYICKCPERYTGETCEIEISSCSPDYCDNFGTCIETDRKPVCECAPGYAGDFCEIQQNFCSNNPCESGQCLNSDDGFVCKCPPGIIGRRCHLRPCDYLPCHKNAQCVDLPVLGATRRSYRCVCPKGLKGNTCTQIKSACEANPCRNNGFCTPVALRNISVLHLKEEFDENIYDKYTCKCPSYFYGVNCETFVSPDYVLEFTKPGVHNYVKLDGPVDNLDEISFCTWIQTNDSFNYGTIFSYATDTIDNMFTLTDYNGIVLYVNGKNTITDITLNDGEWHFICVTWTSVAGKYEIYIDGSLRDSGTNLSANTQIEANGTVVVGQEQDSIGSSFSDSESFVGRIAYMDIWNRRISADEMFEYYTTCDVPYQGNIFTWTDFRLQIYGAVKIMRSPFCRRCQQNLVLRNGYIRYLSNRAFHYCSDGYRMQGPTIRNCLRTSKWSLPVPYCRSIHCRHLPNLLNGQIHMEKTNTGEVVKYSCNDNYYLAGSKTRYCLSNGTWSDSPPECISLIQCKHLNAPLNGRLIYANEHGRIADNKSNYPMGTFVEVQCENETMLKGEGSLSCIESGTWDLPVPECIRKPSTATTTTTAKPPTTSTTNKISTMTTSTTTTTRTPTKTKVKTTTTTTKKPKIISQSKTTSVVNVQHHTVAATASTPPVLKYEQHPAAAAAAATTTVSKLQPFKIKSLPDKPFWNDLKQLYFYGCHHQSATKSFLCAHLKNPTNYTDLTLFELPDTNDFKHMDQNLLTHLMRAEEILNLQPDLELTVESLFPFILYGHHDGDDDGDDDETGKKRMPSTVENAFRFVLCLYIDTILFDKNLNQNFFETIPASDDNITQKLKYFIVRIASKANDDYMRAVQLRKNDSANVQRTTTTKKNTETVGISSKYVLLENDDNESAEMQSSTTIQTMNKHKSIVNSHSKITPPKTISTIASKTNHNQFHSTTIKPTNNNLDSILENESVDESCQLESLPDTPPNSFISEIKTENETIFNMPDRLYLIGPVALRTRAYFVCKEGYRAKSNAAVHYFECNESLKWNGNPIECEAITCGAPIISFITYNSRSSKSVYSYGQKLQLKCNKGYELKGESFVQCLSTGTWSQNISSCTRIACPSPELPDRVKIPNQSSYFYSDRLIITCSDLKTVEVICQEDGQWSHSPKQLCAT